MEHVAEHEHEPCCAHCAEKTDFAKAPAENEAESKVERLSRALLIVGAAIFAVGLVSDFTGLIAFPSPAVRLILFLAAYLLVGGEVLLHAGRNISKGQVFDENFLMAVASIGAFAIGEYPEGVAVMLFYRIGEAFEDMAVSRSKRAITALMDIRPDRANLITENGVLEVAPETVRVGSLISVRPGERIPLDGVVRGGISALDTSALTGESMPRDVFPGSEALSGSVNGGGLLTVEVTRLFGESAVMKILELVQNASARKAPAENFITKFARYYTPAVVICAVCLALIPPIVSGGVGFGEWVGRALVFLVVSCPCALVISIPLSYFGGVGGASRNGILIKGGNYLEVLSRAKTVVFDKTGTLTKGKIRVSEILPAAGRSEEDVLRLAAAAEQASTHPIAAAILAAAGAAGAGAAAGAAGAGIAAPTAYEEIAGKGLRAVVNGSEILAGSGRLMDAFDIAYTPADRIGTAVYTAEDGRYAGCLILEDEVKPDSKAAAAALRSAGVTKLVMLSGDNDAAAGAVAAELGLDAYFAELLPDQKVERLEMVEREAKESSANAGTLVYVGDGINDAPVLARADVGVAMGGLGSDAAIEAADAVLMTDEPSKLAVAIRIAKKTHGIVLQNIVFALGVKGLLLVLGALGLASMWAAVFGDVGVALIAILNAMRALRAA